SQVARYAKLGMNMLRVWGGGLFETEEFYDACDRHGIMVWQDFPYACGYYPDDEPAQAVARAEAEHHIKRLRDRACHVLWCGNNENRSMYYGQWPGPGTQVPRFYGNTLYDEVLKAAVEAGDPGKPYTESSPLLAKGMPGIDKPTVHSDDHYWDVWHGRGDWNFYRESDTRFSSEFGFASSCSNAAWQQVTKRSVNQNDPIVRWHDKTNKGWDTFRGMVELHYPPAKSLADWIYTSQLNQRDAMACAIEHYRANPACRGALIWQINDCWPVQSWALEDYHRQVKPAGFELHRLYAPVLISVLREDDAVEITVSNDGQEQLKSKLSATFFDTVTGQEVQRAAFEVALAPDSRGVVGRISTTNFDSTRTACRVSLAGLPQADRWLLLCEPKQAKFGDVKVSVSEVEGRLLIETEGFVFDLVVLCDGTKPCVTDASLHLEGTRAYTGANLRVSLPLVRPVGALTVRSLAGIHSGPAKLAAINGQLV
ncbi:MAG: hypothetical protein ABUL49_00460, partial [bacterium]